MAFPQTTFEEIIDSERQMVLSAEDRYGNHFRNARTISVFLSRSIVSVDHDRLHFGRFLAIMKKHHMLAILSAIRLHKVQARSSPASDTIGLRRTTKQLLMRSRRRKTGSIVSKLMRV
jgi:hypothetical protein